LSGAVLHAIQSFTAVATGYAASGKRQASLAVL